MVRTKVRGSTTGRPIMRLLDLLGRRWTLRIVWELREQPRRFRELQDLIGASPTIVNTRLAELREARLVELDEAQGYRLTAPGRELLGRGGGRERDGVDAARVCGVFAVEVQDQLVVGEMSAHSRGSNAVRIFFTARKMLCFVAFAFMPSDAPISSIECPW